MEKIALQRLCARCAVMFTAAVGATLYIITHAMAHAQPQLCVSRRRFIPQRFWKRLLTIRLLTIRLLTVRTSHLYCWLMPAALTLRCCLSLMPSTVCVALHSLTTMVWMEL